MSIRSQGLRFQIIFLSLRDQKSGGVIDGCECLRFAEFDHEPPNGHGQREPSDPEENNTVQSTQRMKVRNNIKQSPKTKTNTKKIQTTCHHCCAVFTLGLCSKGKKACDSLLRAFEAVQTWTQTKQQYKRCTPSPGILQQTFLAAQMGDASSKQPKAKKKTQRANTGN
jgi:hypothetical protein